jgi:hypothetical protein
MHNKLTDLNDIFLYHRSNARVPVGHATAVHQTELHPRLHKSTSQSIQCLTCSWISLQGQRYCELSFSTDRRVQDKEIRSYNLIQSLFLRTDALLRTGVRMARSRTFIRPSAHAHITVREVDPISSRSATPLAFVVVNGEGEVSFLLLHVLCSPLAQSQHIFASSRSRSVAGRWKWVCSLLFNLLYIILAPS